jgi:hypothetical protein
MADMRDAIRFALPSICAAIVGLVFLRLIRRPKVGRARRLTILAISLTAIFPCLYIPGVVLALSAASAKPGGLSRLVVAMGEAIAYSSFAGRFRFVVLGHLGEFAEEA